MNKKLFLIDGYSLIYRSFWAFIKSPIFSPGGRNISAVFGFLKTLFYLIDKFDPQGLCVVLDSAVPTFRHEIFPEYKGTRDKAPEELHEQVPILVSILESMGISVISRDRYEADDIMAALAKNITRDEKSSSFIVSSDKDLMQVIDESIHMLRYEKGNYADVDAQGVVERMGIAPGQIIDYLALAGDSSDNIPGVQGIGPKTAVNLLKSFLTLEGIYEHLDECPKGAKVKLEKDRDNAFLSKKLVSLFYDIPLDYSFDDFIIDRVKFSDAFPLLQKLGAKGLVLSLEKISGIKNTSSESLSGTLSGWKRGKYEAVTTLEGLDAWVKKIRENKWFALDIETDSLDTLKAKPAGFSLSISAGKGCYIPLSAGGKIYFGDDDLRPIIRDLVTDSSLKLIGHNFKYDYKVLKKWGVKVTNLAFDTMIASWLLDTSAPSYGMDALCERLFQYKTISYSDIVPKNSLFPDVPLETAAEYAAEDADITYRFYEDFSVKIEKRGFSELFYNLEMPIVTILGDMELEGISLDSKKLSSYSILLGEELKKIESEIYNECGKEFNIGSTKQLQEVLFTDRKLKPVKKTKTGYSTDIKVLEILSREDVVPALVLKHRSLSKLKSTYLDALPSLIHPLTGKIHTHFIQTGTATGRLSSKEPNLQNIPIRSDQGRRIREAFTASEGKVLISADYSQIELVVLAHFSGDEGLRNAFVLGEDVHTFTAALIFGVDKNSVTKDQRRVAKTINFGVMYGMSAYRLSRELEIPVKDASGFIDAYFTRYSGIKDFMRRTVENAEKTGVVKTLLGRERKVNGIGSRNKTEKAGAERIAVNTTIQGSAADIVKRAMIAVSKRIAEKNLDIRMLLQIHDELIFEAASCDLMAAESMIREEMEGAAKLSVPLRVSIESGKSWGELH